ncbi:MAG: alanine racemase [Bacteroidia bacterium]|nr:alanine racemase [Bacteroidia bacterium]NNF31444.1 alanine racemase [Flavobacteriaceae bacterium]MBT8275519.1 alanine racemase [Bacteroidia bacterium]NNJ82081.1 alanine racemase [Flavobacteriaceae bacterium]NNK54023.1 alanine racemase [Flavobacteriaceae bacterium]
MPKASETILEIDLNALDHNYRFITSNLKPTTRVLGVVKASGYGSDGAEIARELVELGADYLAVAYVNEGVELRDAGIEAPVLVLHPQPVNFDVLIERCLEPALYSARVLKSFIAKAEEHSQKDYPVHLKFNTGLNRLGFWENDTEWITERLSGTSAIKVKSMFSHLAASEDASEKDFTLNQIKSFKAITEDMRSKLGYEMMLHQSNTSAILNYPEAEFDMVRTGIGLYGYGNNPSIDTHLIPVLHLKTVISQIHMIEPGETVGYNRAYAAKGYEKTATLPIGHADGIPRSLGNKKGSVIISGQKADIIGNVCMDMMMVDVTNIDCKEGDEVIVIGEKMPASELAAAGNTISYELLTALSHRIKRVVCRK